MGVDDTQPLITHLIELRKRLINSILAILVIFLALVYFANDIYQLVSAPLIRQMPVGATMIATDVASPFFTPIKLTLMSYRSSSAANLAASSKSPTVALTDSREWSRRRQSSKTGHRFRRCTT